MASCPGSLTVHVDGIDGLRAIAALAVMQPESAARGPSRDSVRRER